ncbi:unnamed protein product [Vitrella brassicaformis CCMP3155]|uniref:Uncharacterized protein n=3 Tax=Vitrella brassicaformis TaxID=1169539 RepID=A0A0G4GNA1_VITBC|nr:unnamed protein product [Vitrella brassicaformis CCMP3155]|eukprot:CEM31679.1 unnamed protein product [Vitrella brassicaformis CCMP3155]
MAATQHPAGEGGHRKGETAPTAKTEQGPGDTRAQLAQTGLFRRYASRLMGPSRTNAQLTTHMRISVRLWLEDQRNKQRMKREREREREREMKAEEGFDATGPLLVPVDPINQKEQQQQQQQQQYGAIIDEKEEPIVEDLPMANQEQPMEQQQQQQEQLQQEEPLVSATAPASSGMSWEDRLAIEEEIQQVKMEMEIKHMDFLRLYGEEPNVATRSDQSAAKEIEDERQERRARKPGKTQRRANKKRRCSRREDNSGETQEGESETPTDLYGELDVEKLVRMVAEEASERSAQAPFREQSQTHKQAHSRKVQTVWAPPPGFYTKLSTPPHSSHGLARSESGSWSNPKRRYNYNAVKAIMREENVDIFESDVLLTPIRRGLEGQKVGCQQNEPPWKLGVVDMKKETIAVLNPMVQAENGKPRNWTLCHDDQFLSRMRHFLYDEKCRLEGRGKREHFDKWKAQEASSMRPPANIEKDADLYTVLYAASYCTRWKNVPVAIERISDVDKERILGELREEMNIAAQRGGGVYPVLQTLLATGCPRIGG